MQRLLVLNLLISFLWPILNGDYTLRSLLIGFLFGFILLSLAQRRYGYFSLQVARFAGYVLYAILRSNLLVTGIVLAKLIGSKPNLRPGIVAIPLHVTKPVDITILATLITLTPGTLSVDLGENVSGRLWPYGETEENTIGAKPGTSRGARSQEESAPSPRGEESRSGERGAAALLVHSIDIADPQAFRTEIKQKFERPLLDLRSILVAMDDDNT